jgi:hypothetical protein
VLNLLYQFFFFGGGVDGCILGLRFTRQKVDLINEPVSNSLLNVSPERLNN